MDNMDNKEIQKPSYYAIIPANVRYDKDLNGFAKLLYGEITALCNKEGFCWATNNHFAQLYNCSTRTVSRAISNLNNKQYIHVNIIKNDDNSTQRKLYLSTPHDKNGVKSNDKNDANPHDKNDAYNNTSINNTRENNTDVSFLILGEFKNVKMTTEEYEKLKENFNNVDNKIEELSGYMTSTGKRYKSHYATVRNWLKRDNLEKKAEQQVNAGKTFEEKMLERYGENWKAMIDYEPK